jgi:hypothetical protein
MDVLRPTFLGKNMTVSRSMCLHSATIVCRYDRGKLTITPAPGDQNSSPLEIDLRAMARPHEFVECVFRAALVRMNVPELPQDALLG